MQRSGDKSLDRSTKGGIQEHRALMGRTTWDPELRKALPTVAVPSLYPCVPVPRLMKRTAMLWKVSLLVAMVVMGTHIWTIDKEFVDITKDLDYFVASVEFAVTQFNDNNPEENTYRLLEVGRAQKKVSPCVEHLSLNEQTWGGGASAGTGEERIGPAAYSAATGLETLPYQGPIFLTLKCLELLLSLGPGPQEPLVSNTLSPLVAAQPWGCRLSTSYGPEHGGMVQM
ncbi:hypothetical protein NN561_009792 [Cricetulus griseus]